MFTRPALLLGTAALAIGVAACGGGSSSSSAPGSTAASTATSAASAASVGPGVRATQRLRVAADPSGGLRYTKSTMTAKAGVLAITFTNNSPLPHNLTLQVGTSGPVLGATPTFDGGSRTLTLRLKPGRYTYYCSVPGHRDAGMHGLLTVT